MESRRVFSWLTSHRLVRKVQLYTLSRCYYFGVRGEASAGGARPDVVEVSGGRKIVGLYMSWKKSFIWFGCTLIKGLYHPFLQILLFDSGISWDPYQNPYQSTTIWWDRGSLARVAKKNRQWGNVHAWRYFKSWRKNKAGENTPKKQHILWKMLVGRLCSFSNGSFSGNMLIFGGVISFSLDIVEKFPSSQLLDLTQSWNLVMTLSQSHIQNSQ